MRRAHNVLVGGLAPISCGYAYGGPDADTAICGGGIDQVDAARIDTVSFDGRAVRQDGLQVRFAQVTGRCAVVHHAHHHRPGPVRRPRPREDPLRQAGARRLLRQHSPGPWSTPRGSGPVPHPPGPNEVRVAYLGPSVPQQLRQHPSRFGALRVRIDVTDRAGVRTIKHDRLSPSPHVSGPTHETPHERGLLGSGRERRGRVCSQGFGRLSIADIASNNTLLSALDRLLPRPHWRGRRLASPSPPPTTQVVERGWAPRGWGVIDSRLRGLKPGVAQRRRWFGGGEHEVGVDGGGGRWCGCVDLTDIGESRVYLDGGVSRKR